MVPGGRARQSISSRLSHRIATEHSAPPAGRPGGWLVQLARTRVAAAVADCITPQQVGYVRGAFSRSNHHLALIARRRHLRGVLTPLG